MCVKFDRYTALKRMATVDNSEKVSDNKLRVLNDERRGVGRVAV